MWRMTQNDDSSALSYRPRHHVRVHRSLLREPIGLGQVVEGFTHAAGVQPCPSCQQRARWLDRWIRLEPEGNGRTTNIDHLSVAVRGGRATGYRLNGRRRPFLRSLPSRKVRGAKAARLSSGNRYAVLLAVRIAIATIWTVGGFILGSRIGIRLASLVRAKLEEGAPARPSHP